MIASFELRETIRSGEGQIGWLFLAHGIYPTCFVLSLLEA